MKKILFILFLYSANAYAQSSLTSVVNGVTVYLSVQDSANLVQQWQANLTAYIADSIAADTSFSPIKTAFTPMVGKTFSELTTTQKQNMIEAIMWKLGIVGRNRRIKTLEQWLQKQ